MLSKLTSATKPATDRVVSLHPEFGSMPCLTISIQELKLHLDKGLTEKFVVGVVRKDLATEVFKKRFDLVNGWHCCGVYDKIYSYLSCRTVLAKLPPTRPFLPLNTPFMPKLKNWLIPS